MAALLFRNHKQKLSHVTDRLYHTELGCTLMSALFGVALAFMFQRVCKGAKCIIYKSPPPKDIEGSIYEVNENECYMYIPRVTKCDE